jgi:hypothetical protein
MLIFWNHGRAPRRDRIFPPYPHIPALRASRIRAIIAQAVPLRRGRIPPVRCLVFSSEYKNALFGELRSILQRPPSEEVWRELCDNVNKWPYVDVEHVILPYASGLLDAWPDRLREAPRTWLDDLRILFCRRLAYTHARDDLDRVCELIRSGQLRAITELDLSHGDYDGFVLQIADDSRLDALTWLELAFCDLGERGMLALAASPILRQLRYLGLFQGSVGADASPEAYTTFVTSANLAQMEHLDLGGHEGFVDEAASALFRSPHLGQLTTLDLSFTSISDGSIEALLTSPLLSQLTSLDLSHCMISDAGALAIASSPRVAGLRSLKLLDNYPMTARGLAALATSPHLGADLRAVFARAAQPQE